MAEEKDDELDTYIDIKYINSKVMLFKDVPVEILIPFIPNLLFQNSYYLFISMLWAALIIYLNKQDLNIRKAFRMIGFVLKDRLVLPIKEYYQSKD